MGTKKLKYKVGDKVRVKSLEWYNNNKNISKEIIAKEGRDFGVFTQYMSSWCDEVLTIDSVRNGFYTVIGMGWNWYDWMLEDELVAEEKQEVQQQNKNNIKMTKQEVLDYLKDKKFICKSKEERSIVFSKLETLGIDVSNMSDFAFMFFIEEKFGLTYTDSVTYWIEDNKKSIEVSEILSIDIEIEKPKFDPKTLKPFDKVLVRDDKDGFWRCNLFSHIIGEEDYEFECILKYWNY